MLRQIISSGPARAASSGLRLAAQKPLSRPQFRQLPSISARAIRPAASRWYSAEAESASGAAKEGSEAKSQAESQAKDEGSDAEAALRKQLEAKEVEAREWKDKCLRSVADFRNLQDRTQREMKATRDFAIQKFAKDLVDSVDNFDRALGMVSQEKLNAEDKSEDLQELSNLYDGLKLTEEILTSTLKKHGLERFDPEGEKFDPNEHEATFMTPMPDKEDSTVILTQQKGFKLNGRILRAAKVGVVKNK